MHFWLFLTSLLTWYKINFWAVGMILEYIVWHPGGPLLHAVMYQAFCTCVTQSQIPLPDLRDLI